jgi:exonuclease 3'-5' domain-containing protein 1
MRSRDQLAPKAGKGLRGVNVIEYYHPPPSHLVRKPVTVPCSPTMYIDLEGVDLCREGSISILTLLVDTGIPSGCVYLVDVHTLGAQVFNTAGAKKKTLKDILQDKEIPKVFFDVRNDSDALFAHFGVALQGIADVQLLES